MSIDTIILFGPTSVGKGTHAKRLISEDPRLVHVSTGQIIRDIIKLGGSQAYDLVEATVNGGYIEDDLMFGLFQNKMRQLSYSVDFHSKKNILLADGICRTLPQAQAFGNAPFNYNVLGVVNLMAPYDSLQQRNFQRMLREGRSDDSSRAFQQKMEIFSQEAGPVLDFYTPELVFDVDTSGTLEQAYAYTLRAVNQIIRMNKPYTGTLEQKRGEY